MKTELSEREQQVYELRFVQKLTLDKCAEKLGISIHRVRECEEIIKDKQNINFLHYCYTARIKGRRVRQHVVTDKGELAAADIARRRMCYYNECEAPEIMDFKKEFILDMEGVIAD